MTEIYILGTIIISVIGALVWYLKNQTKHQNERDDRREKRDEKREDRLIVIVDETLKTNTESTKELSNVIGNHLVSAIKNLQKKLDK